jgi:hypothetical protein
MDPATADRTERATFAALPDLGAVPRRGLALALAGMPRTGIASELGLGGAELSAELAAGRKALRRTRAGLPSGGRCERAERALSDRLDGASAAMDERFLDAHLTRCARCRTHESELAAAVAQLRAHMTEPPALERAPARARLRVVPPAPLLPPAPEPVALSAPEPPAEIATPEPPAEIAAPEAPPAAAARHQRIRAALPVAVAVLIAVGLVAAAIALLSAFGADPNIRAPWDGPDAPVVHPAPISGQ